MACAPPIGTTEMPLVVKIPPTALGERLERVPVAGPSTRTTERESRSLLLTASILSAANPPVADARHGLWQCKT
jgi:hypothetical protein